MASTDTSSFYYVSEERKEANREATKAYIPDLIESSNLEEIVLREEETDDELLERIYDQQGIEKFKVNVDNYTKEHSIFCIHDGVFYRAKITGIIRQDGQKVFKVHYHGWNKRFDEQIHIKDAVVRFRPFDDIAGALERLNGKQRRITGANKSKKLLPKTFNASLPKKANKQEKEDNFEDLPDELAEVMFTDRANSKNNKYPKIPGRVTMQQIVNEYKQEMDSPDAKYLHLFVDSILRGFDKYVRIFLLFENEWPTYDALSGRNVGSCGQEFVPHNHYGFVHLLRTCTVLDKIYTKVNVDAKFIEFFNENPSDFLDFLEKNVKKYYNAAEDYQ